jgi:replication factor A1
MTDAVEQKPAEFTTVDKLLPDSTGHNLTLKVLDTKVTVDRPQGKGPGSGTRVAECLVGDQTGVIVFTARNEQVEMLKPGSYYTFHNAKVDMYKSTMRLAVDKFGRLEENAEASFKVKEDFNLSSIEFELVSVAATQSSNGQQKANGVSSTTNAEHSQAEDPQE